jgi:hypothetical protein
MKFIDTNEWVHIKDKERVLYTTTLISDKKVIPASATADPPRRKSGNPERHWIPHPSKRTAGKQVRNDEQSDKNIVMLYISKEGL